jgi:Cys-rich four helix bundle protein (predicted Tat secretion target)
VGAVVVAGGARAQTKSDKASDKKGAHVHPTADAPAKAPPSAKLQAVINGTAECVQAGRVCLASCTEHLAMGMSDMASCQRAVMNMLAVCGAMADVAGFRNADEKNMRALAAACAAFCRACEKACEAHAAHHVECKACLESCRACATACEAL